MPSFPKHWITTGVIVLGGLCGALFHVWYLILTDSVITYYQLSWSPDGKYVAFVREEDGAYDGMYVISIENMNMTQLDAGTYIHSSPYYRAVWAPDSQSLVFMVDWGNSGWISDIYRVNVDGSNLVNLTGDLPDAFRPSWSPDSQRIVFYAGRQIYVVDADGSNLSQLTDIGQDARSPAWAPDGRSIAFLGWRKNRAIFMMDTDGANPSYTAGIEHGVYDFAWSPDGRYFAAYSRLEETSSALYVMDTDGANLVQIAEFEDDHYNLIWSLDGSKIAFYAYESDSIYVLDVAQPLTLTQIEGIRAWLPIVWSPDSTRIAYVTDKGIFVKNIRTDTLEQVSTSIVNNLFWGDPNHILSIDLRNRWVWTFPVHD